MASRFMILPYFFLMIIKNMSALDCYNCSSETNSECNLNWTRAQEHLYTKFIIRNCDKMCSQKIGLYSMHGVTIKMHPCSFTSIRTHQT